MTLPDPQVHSWIASLVDRTADQLRSELALLVRRVQDAAPTHAVRLPDAPVSPRAAARDPRDLHAVWRSADRERLAGPIVAADVLDAMAALDEAASLTEILNVLVERTAVHAGRVLLVVARGDALIGWRWHGYTADPHEATTLAIRPDDQGLVMRAARSGLTETGPGPAASGTGERLAAQNRGAVAVPLRVEGQVVAVLYAEAVEADAEAEAKTATDPGPLRSPWPEVVGALVRYAARCLESMTARRVHELVHLPATGHTAEAMQSS